ncbi:MAG TPA: hypothetical protein DEH78_26220, partial [Solibacterales bacterium]|nr:hypothetical protein [Bryobacterales bacterium]
SAPLGRPDAPLNSAVQPGPVPALGLSVHGPDDLRRTVFLWRTADPAGKPAALFGLSVWRGGEPVPAPQLVTAFRGTMIAQDFALRADGAALGAGLTDEPDEPLRYQLRSWSVTPAGQFARNPSVTLRWDSPSEIRNAVVRVDQRGGALLVWQASDGVWWWAGPDGLAVRMKEELQNMDAPLAIFWVDFIYPGLLYNAPGSGLTIGYLALPPRSMPMVSASLP